MNTIRTRHPQPIDNNSTVVRGLVAILGQLTSAEKAEFARLVDLDELLRLRRVKPSLGPGFYVGTTDSGLSLELPESAILPFVYFLAETLTRSARPTPELLRRIADKAIEFAGLTLQSSRTRPQVRESAWGRASERPFPVKSGFKHHFYQDRIYVRA